MDKDTQDLYVKELNTQAELAMRAGNAVDDCINAIREEAHQRELNSQLRRPIERQNHFILVPETFRQIHSFLTHASNISKLFWPVVQIIPPVKANKLAKWQRTTDRGTFLRALYNLPTGSILENRDLRNHLEHFDERLDDFSVERDASTIGKGVADMYIGDLSNLFGPRPDFVLRHYHQSTGDFTFRGVTYSLTTILTAIQQVQVTSQSLLAS